MLINVYASGDTVDFNAIASYSPEAVLCTYCLLAVWASVSIFACSTVDGDGEVLFTYSISVPATFFTPAYTAWPLYCRVPYGASDHSSADSSYASLLSTIGAANTVS